MPQPSHAPAEIVGLFHSSEALERAISELASAGWDRAEMSLLGAPELLAQADRAQANRAQVNRPSGQRQAETTGQRQVQAGAPQSPVISKDDVRQMRTLTSGMAGVAAAFVAAGATVMSGGAALAAIVGAAAAGGGAAAAVEGLGHSADEKREQALRKQVEAGGILLWALLRDSQDEAKARDILQQAGATEIHVQPAAKHRDKTLPLH